jgi:hypothetical protein
MSGQLPTTPKFVTVGFKSNQKTLVSTTDSGKVFKTQVDGQRFAFTCRYPMMSQATFKPIMAFIMKQRSRKENFTVVLPLISSTTGSATGTISVDGSHNAGDTTITVDGMSASASGFLKAGDYIKFSGHSKVYCVVEDLDSDASGDGTITIEPPLRSNLADDETITYDDVPFTVYQMNDIQTFNVDGLRGDLFTFEIDVMEAL